MHNQFKAQATAIIIAIVALIIVAGSGYLLLQNRSQKVAPETTTTLSPTTTELTTITTTNTTLVINQTCDSICKSKGYERGDCNCSLGDNQTVPSINIGVNPDCACTEYENNLKKSGKSVKCGSCCCRGEGRYSCVSPERQLTVSDPNCIYDPNGKFTSLEECIKTCPLPTCTDSDGGDNIYVKGVVTLKGGVQTREIEDVCQGLNALTEIYCSNGRFMENYEHCPSGYVCQNGACIKSQ